VALSVRELVRRDEPFTLVANEGRVAPVHVLNGFIASGLGTSNNTFREIIRAMHPDVLSDDSPSWFRATGTTEKRVERRQFADDLRVTLDPDRRTFRSGTGSSVFPVVGQVIGSSNPSDSGMGSCLWALVEPRWSSDKHAAFREMVFGGGVDPVTDLARVVGRVDDGAPPSPPGGTDPFADAWFRGGSGPGARLADNLAAFLSAFVAPTGGAERLYRLQLLGYALHLSMCLAQLFGPRVASGEDAELGDALALVVMGGQPPGDVKTPVGAGVTRSFSKTVRDAERAYVRLLTRSIEGAKIGSGTSPTPVDRCLYRVSQISGQRVTETDLEALATEVGLRDASELAALDSPSDMAEALVESGPLSSGMASARVRTLSARIGFAGPDRGAGSPRFVVETPLLVTLVTGLCSGQSPLPFEQFLDLARRNLGLVFGPSREMPAAAALDGVWDPGSAERMLGENAESLRKRLVRTGLGREYSDGHTEVGPRV
jgi:hypothetical protein